MKILKHIIAIVLVGSLLIAGTDGTIRGRVTDDKGEGLPGTQVYIPGTSYGTMTDGDGNYILLNIPVGEYDAVFAMIGYKQHNVKNLSVVMDQTQWLNVKLQVESISGEEVIVEAQRDMVEHDVTGTKQTVSGEAIKSLPLKDVSELYSLQSGVVKVESRQQGIPGHEERGLEEVHVRGGRSGEIAYMIDGMYIKNPVFGGIINDSILLLKGILPGGATTTKKIVCSIGKNVCVLKGCFSSISIFKGNFLDRDLKILSLIFPSFL